MTDFIAASSTICWFEKMSRGKTIPLAIWRYVKQVDDMPHLDGFEKQKKATL
jgi:hypothetical protein